MKVDVADITAEIDSLIEEEIIKDTEKNQEGVKIRKINVTAEGKTIAEDSTVAEVRYEYDWRSEIPSGERDTNEHPSRAFCKKLMELKKVFSRAEIDAISARVGLNVWEYRGGWWNDNGFNSPSCRHIWKAVILKRKK